MASLFFFCTETYKIWKKNKFIVNYCKSWYNNSEKKIKNYMNDKKYYEW